MQVAKFGDGYIAATREVTEIVAAEREAQLASTLIAAERSAMELLQAAALPSSLPTVRDVTLSAVYEPADPIQPVGGDWYDAFLLDDDRIALVIADVSGHGREAAAFMLQVPNIFRAVAIQHALPADVLHHANEVTTRLNEADDHSSLAATGSFICRVGASNGRKLGTCLRLSSGPMVSLNTWLRAPACHSPSSKVRRTHRPRSC